MDSFVEAVRNQSYPRLFVSACGLVALFFILRKCMNIWHLLMLRFFCGSADRGLYKRKKALFEKLHELLKEKGSSLRVIELGSGTGVNFKYLPPGTHLTAVDPLGEAKGDFLLHASEQASIHIEKYLVKGAEDLSELEDASYDAVISTLTLCTVSSVPKTLAQVKRLLRPGGCYLFIDHVLSNNPFIQLVQYLITPVWYFLGGGCHFRRPQLDICKAGFTHANVTEFNGPLKFPLIKRMVEGCAVK